MIVSALAVLCLAAPSAAADNDFSLTWRSGEQSRDASHFETTWTLRGTTLDVHSTASGAHVMPPERDMRQSKPVSEDDLKKVAEHLAAIDKVAKQHRGKETHQQGRYTTIRYTHGRRTVELFFPYWLDDEVHRPKNESKTKLEVLETIDALRGKLVEIQG